MKKIISLASAITLLCGAIGTAYAQAPLYKWNFDNASTSSGTNLTVAPTIIDTIDGYTGGNLVSAFNAANTLQTPASSGLHGSTNANDLALVNSGTYNSASGGLAGGVGNLSAITNFTVSLWFNLSAAVTNFVAINGSGFNGRLFCIDTNVTTAPQKGTGADGNELYIALAQPGGTPGSAGGTSAKLEVGVFINASQPTADPFLGVGGSSPATFTNQWVYLAVAYTTNNGGTASIYVGTTNVSAELTATLTGVGVISPAKTWLATSNLVEIGNRLSDGKRSLLGSIDEVGLYNSALTLAQVQGIQGVVSPPVITTQPSPTILYAGLNASLTVTANGAIPLAYQWNRNGTNLIDGGNISGSRSNVLTVAGVSTTDVFTNYFVVITNAAGAVTSSVVSLSLTTTNGAYEGAVLADNPFAFYTFSETTDPSIGGVEAYDSMGSFNGIYGAGAENGFDGIVGPTPSYDGLVGFPNTNTALGTFYLNVPPTSYVTLPSFNLNNGVGTNVLAITSWIYPVGPQAHGVGIVFCRAGTTVAGLNYNATNSNGSLKLGYIWNNDTNTVNWDSGLTPPQNQWSFVALTVTATNATIYLINTNGLLAATHTYNHVLQKFDGITLIGNDSSSANGGRTFNGSIDEVALFGQALTQNQLSALFGAASGISFFPPTIGGEPVWSPSPVYQGQPAQAAVSAGGTLPLSYRWMAGLNGVYTNLSDGGNISGSTNAILNIAAADPSNALDYIVIITNQYGSITSTPPATLTVAPLGPPLNITLSTIMPLTGPATDWNTSGYWNDGVGGSLGASSYVISNPHSTFEVLPGGRLRTPFNVVGTFPGDFTDTLKIDGDGVLDTSGATMGEIRFKSLPTTISHLVMNGGQIDASVNPGPANLTVINGQMDILANTPVYDDSGNDQGVTINAFLTGTGNIELHNTGFAITNKTPYNIAGNTNSYSGTWNVVLGVLLGTGTNALGTNTITVGSAGYLETTYDIHNAGGLILNGQMLLHQNDTFGTVQIGGGSPLAPGTYTFAQLTNAYPAFFPATWPLQTGSSVSTGSGSITVPGSATVPITFQLSGSNLQINWSQGTLQQTTNLLGPWVAVPGANPPSYTNTISPAVPQMFFRVHP